MYITCAVSDKTPTLKHLTLKWKFTQKRLTPESFKSMLTDQCFEIKQSNFWNAKKAMEILPQKYDTRWLEPSD